MTIERGRAWGEPGGLPAGGILVRTDAQARAIVERARRANEAIPPLGLLGGDLCRSLGGTGDEERLSRPEAPRLPVDVGSVLLDGRQYWFVAHLVARRPAWRGPILAVMNAQFLDRWDVAPRAHPGDGHLDVLQADLRPSDKWKAWRRLPRGAHVPHPGIRESRMRAMQHAFARPVPVWLDGVRMPPVRSISVRVEPDALTVVV